MIETPVFAKYADAIWDEDEHEAFIDWIADHPDSGDLIPDTGGLRKVRWSRPGLGKRGGSRVVYFLRTERGEVVLLIVYAKSSFENLSKSILKRLKEAFDGS